MTFARKADKTGRSTNRPAGKRAKEALSFPKDCGYCIPLPKNVICSPSFRALPLRARGFLDAIMAEWCANNGLGNGDLIVTYDQAEAFGVWRDTILLAIFELQSVGLIAVERGARSYGTRQAPSRYRLTFLGTPDGLSPTHEWKAIKTDEDARNRLSAAHSRLDDERNARRERRKSRVAAREGEAEKREAAL